MAYSTNVQKFLDNVGKSLGNASVIAANMQESKAQADTVNKSNNLLTGSGSSGGGSLQNKNTVTVNLGNGPINVTPTTSAHKGAQHINGNYYKIEKQPTSYLSTGGNSVLGNAQNSSVRRDGRIISAPGAATANTGSTGVSAGGGSLPTASLPTASLIKPITQASVVSAANLGTNGSLPTASLPTAQGNVNPYLNENGNRTAYNDNDVMLTEHFRGRPDASVVWNEGTGNVYINGTAVPKSEVYLSPDGKAFVGRDVAERIYAQTLENDPTSSYSINKKYEDVLGQYEDELSRIYNEGDFKYNAASDPMYKVYSQYYDMLADEAVDNALAQMMARTGGYVNSNALSAAYQARNNYIQQKANILPQLEQAAYEKWANDRSYKTNAINSALANIAANMSDYANTVNNAKLLELESENSILDRALNRYNIDVNDANTDAALAQEAAQFAQQMGLNYYELNQTQQNLLRQMALDEWRAQQQYKAKPVTTSTSGAGGYYAFN